MYTLIGIVFLLWLVGFVGHIGGGFIHGLLLICGILFLVEMFAGRRAV